MSYNQEECSELSSLSEEDVFCPGPLYRVKVFFLGDYGSGKSSLVQSLIGQKPNLIDQSTDGVDLHLWYPFKNSNNGELLDFPPTREQRHLVLEIWDLAGRQICQGVHPIYFTPCALYIVVYNSADDTSLDSVAATVTTIQHKCPGGVILIVGSQADKVVPSETNKNTTKARNCLVSLRTSENEIATNLNQHRCHVRSIANTSLINGRAKQLEEVLNKRVCLPSKILSVSCSTGKGISELRKEILNTVLDTRKFPHLTTTLKQETINLYDEILKLREKGSVIIRWKDFRNLTVMDNLIPEEDLETETQFFHIIGGVLDLRIPSFSDPSSSERFICVHPQAFANSTCALHLDDDRKQFKLEAKRFWPKESGFKKPDPSILVRSLEKILKHGLVREVLLPLLWQNACYTDDQTQVMLRVLLGLGLLVAGEKARGNCEGLALPNFRSLIVTNQYYCPLSDRLPDNRPQLHWTPKPFKGDVQVGWRYEFIAGAPLFLGKRLMAVCRSACSDISYLHCWKYGRLIRMNEIWMCLLEDARHFDICCRANADDPGREDEAVQLIWTYLSPLLKAVDVLLKSWPGLVTEIFILPLGHQMFGGEKVEGDPSLSLLECLVNWQKEEKMAFRDGENIRSVDLDLLFPFKDCNQFHSIQQFIDFLLMARSKRLSTIKPTSPARRTPPILTQINKPTKREKINKKKRTEIKWNLNQKEIKVSEPVSQTVSIKKTPEAPVSIKKTPEAPKISASETKPPTNKLTSTNPKSTEEKKVETPTAKNDEDPKQEMSGKRINEEDEIKEANRVASAFVAAVMATAVAEYITSEFKDGDLSKKPNREAQVRAAQMTAEAAMAAQTGNIEGAGRAVISAAHAMETLLTSSSGGFKKNGGTSKVCVLL